MKTGIKDSNICGNCIELPPQPGFYVLNRRNAPVPLCRSCGMIKSEAGIMGLLYHQQRIMGGGEFYKLKYNGGPKLDPSWDYNGTYSAYNNRLA